MKLTLTSFKQLEWGLYWLFNLVLSQGRAQYHDCFVLLPIIYYQILCSWLCGIWNNLLCFYLHPQLGAHEVEWEVMATSHCYSQGRWWLNTLWITFTRLWQHLLLSHKRLCYCSGGNKFLEIFVRVRPLPSQWNMGVTFGPMSPMFAHWNVPWCLRTT